MIMTVHAQIITKILYAQGTSYKATPFAKKFTT